MTEKNSNRRENWDIVLRAIQQSPGERTIDLDGISFGWHDDKLCHILYKWRSDQDIFVDAPDDEVWVISDISFNAFIEKCQQLSDEDITGIAADTALTSFNRTR